MAWWQAWVVCKRLVTTSWWLQHLHLWRIKNSVSLKTQRRARMANHMQNMMRWSASTQICKVAAVPFAKLSTPDKINYPTHSPKFSCGSMKNKWWWVLFWIKTKLIVQQYHWRVTLDQLYALRLSAPSKTSPERPGWQKCADKLESHTIDQATVQPQQKTAHDNLAESRSLTLPRPK